MSDENFDSTLPAEHDEAVYDVPVKVTVVLGNTPIEIRDILKTGRGAVLELDRKIGEAVDIFVNNRIVARGKTVIEDNRLAIDITEILKSDGDRS